MRSTFTPLHITSYVRHLIPRPMPHHILVVDAHPSGPEGLRHWIDRAADLELWGHAATPSDASKALAVAQPDLILADVASTDTGGIEWIARSHEAHPSVPVMVAGYPEADQHVERALRAGARGYVCRSTSPDAMLAAIRSVLAGHVVLPESARDRLLSASAPRDAERSVATLSDRQRDVLRLIGQGLTTTEIAERLGISPKTVETHRVHIKRRLNLETANALICWAALWVESETR